MGYFNFYLLRKLIRDLINNKHFKKFLFFIVVFLFFLFIWNNVVNAAYEFTFNGNNYSIPDIPYTPSDQTPYGIVNAKVLNGNIFVQATYSSQPLICYKDGSNYTIGGGTSGTYGTYSLYFYNGAQRRWVTNITNSTGTYNNLLSNFQSTSLGTLESSFIETNYLITYGDYVVASPPESYEVLPYFMNTADDLAKGNQDIVIMPGDFPNTKEIRFGLQVMTETDDGNGNITESWNNVFSPISLTSNSEYYKAVDETGVGYYYVIPWSLLKQNLQLSKHYCYILAYEVQGQTIRDEVYATYGGLTPEDALKNSLDEQTTLINQQLLQIQQMNENIENMFNYQQATTDAVNDLNNTITDDTISSGASDLPSIELSNPAEAPLDNIFMIIYNAFCTGNPQDIVFPIPYTNKNITLSPFYVRDMLNNNGGSWVVTFADIFWQFVIAFFIIKDVSKKVNKIKAGDIENIENTNIKEDML